MGDSLMLTELQKYKLAYHITASAMDSGDAHEIVDSILNDTTVDISEYCEDTQELYNEILEYVLK